MSEENILKIYQEGLATWQRAFNSQDAAGCAAQYTEDAIMTALPFGTFTGRKEIQAFWQDIIDQGFSNVEYTDIKWEAAEDKGYILSSNWTMNKAFGVVHREHWVIDSDGKARLIQDEFEVKGDR